jgi:hypothetical protein
LSEPIVPLCRRTERAADDEIRTFETIHVMQVLPMGSFRKNAQAAGSRPLRMQLPAGRSDQTGAAASDVRTVRLASRLLELVPSSGPSLGLCVLCDRKCKLACQATPHLHPPGSRRTSGQRARRVPPRRPRRVTSAPVQRTPTACGRQLSGQSSFNRGVRRVFIRFIAIETRRQAGDPEPGIATSD